MYFSTEDPLKTERKTKYPAFRLYLGSVNPPILERWELGQVSRFSDSRVRSVTGTRKTGFKLFEGQRLEKYSCSRKKIHVKHFFSKTNTAYGRHWLSWRVRIVGRILKPLSLSRSWSLSHSLSRFHSHCWSRSWSHSWSWSWSLSWSLSLSLSLSWSWSWSWSLSLSWSWLRSWSRSAEEVMMRGGGPKPLVPYRLVHARRHSEKILVGGDIYSPKWRTWRLLDCLGPKGRGSKNISKITLR